MRDKASAKRDRAARVNASAPWRVTHVRALPHYTIVVRFADGTTGEVDLSRLILGPSAGIFAPLHDPVVFARVAIEDGAVAWPGEIDLAPDAMYDSIRTHGRWTPE